MRTKMTILAIGLLLVSITSGACVAKNVVVHVDPDSKLAKKDGVFYALPRTVIAVAVPIKKVTLKKGIYEKFAACFFPDDESAEKIVHRDCKSFEVGDPAINTRGEPDPSEIYMVKIRGHYFEDKSLTIALSESSIPSKVTEETTNHAAEILTQIAQTVTSLALRDITALSDKAAGEEETELDELIRGLDPSVAECADIKLKLERLLGALQPLIQARSDLSKAMSELSQATSALTQARRKVGVKKKEIKAEEDRLIARQDEVIAKRMILDHRTAQFDTLNENGDVLNAVKLYKRIRDLQQKRDELVLLPLGRSTGEAIRTALDELDKQIAALKSKFIGTRSTEKIWVANFEVTPAEAGFGSGRDFRLFELSPSSGVCGTPPLDPLVRFNSLNVPEDFNKCGNTIPPDCDGGIPSNKTVAVSLNRVNDQLFAKIRSSFPGGSESGDRGFYYRIPAVVTATVKLDSKNLFQVDLKIAQLGLTASLPPSTGGRRTKYELEFYETGAMKNFVLGSDALIQAATVKDLGDAAGNVIDARKQAEKQAAAAREEVANANDEVAKTKALSELLESCKKIRDAQIALGREPILPALCNQ